MAHASIMTFNDPNDSIRIKFDGHGIYISRAITEAAQKAAWAVVEGAE